MKMTTVEQVLDLAQTLNRVYESESVASHTMTIKGIESKEDLEQLANQERGNYFPHEDYYCCSVKLGDIDFIITTKQ